MLVFIFNDANGVSCGTVDNEVLLSNNMTIDDVAKLHSDKYFVVDSSELPSEPQQSWILSDDGKITIDHQKLADFNRQNMPTLTPIEFDIKLVDAGLYDQVQGLIQSDAKLKITYTRATFFSRTDPFIDQARIALGLTDEQVDAMWTS